MFTGIVQAVGRVASIGEGSLSVGVPAGFGRSDVRLGESVAVNGCCLTVISDGETLEFNVSAETLRRTSLGSLVVGSAVNLERAMAADGRFGGHMVQGHVDATGLVVSITPQGNSVVFRFQAPAEFDRYLIDKGSVTVDGVSLTVVKPDAGSFDVWVIPHTLQETNLGEKKPGDPVNLEFDMIARYVEKLLAANSA